MSIKLNKFGLIKLAEAIIRRNCSLTRVFCQGSKRNRDLSPVVRVQVAYPSRIIVFDVAKSTIIANLEPREFSRVSLAFSPTRPALFAIGAGSLAGAWSIPDGKVIVRFRLASGTYQTWIKEIFFSPNGNKLYVAGQVWDVDSAIETRLIHRVNKKSKTGLVGVNLGTLG